MDDAFLTYACDVIADTELGLSGSQIVEYCSSFAIEYNKQITYDSYPFEARNKRTALKENLKAFKETEQFNIINFFCGMPYFKNNSAIKDVKEKLYQRYGNLSKEKTINNNLIIQTKHWLSKYPKALKQYENALNKFEHGLYQRNTLDDIRLSFELLIKSLLDNNKSLENQINEIGELLKKGDCSKELINMVPKLIDYYTVYQNNHVKHNDQINSKEIEFIIELTSTMMKFLIKELGEHS